MISLKNNAATYHLTTPDDGVLFDIDADGILDHVAWTPAGSQIALLALDRNNNGLIDDGSELFGTSTLRLDGSLAVNGFAALRDADTNRDGRVDLSDHVYSSFRLWIDANHNGISEASELFSLGDRGLVALHLGYQEMPRRDNNGNAYRFAGSALLNVNGIGVVRRVFDVYLREH
jgi:trimeric autotransporter adhesin